MADLLTAPPKPLELKAHQEIVKKLVELIGITSIMEVLIRLIGADENMYVSHVDAMQWIEDTNVLEMIVDKFSSSYHPLVSAISTHPSPAFLCIFWLAAKVVRPQPLFSSVSYHPERLRPLRPFSGKIATVSGQLLYEFTIFFAIFESQCGENRNFAGSSRIAVEDRCSMWCGTFVRVGVWLFADRDSPEVHANAAETLCAITRFAPTGLSAKISSPSFIGRLFHHALEVSRPKSVLVNSLSVCISLLDPKRHTFGAYYTYNRQMTNGSTVTANPETVEGMLESLATVANGSVPDLSQTATEMSWCRAFLMDGIWAHSSMWLWCCLMNAAEIAEANGVVDSNMMTMVDYGQILNGDLLKLLDVSSAENLLLTTFGKLQPPLGKHRLKIVEFISVLVTVGGEAAERKLIDLGAVQRIIHLFFEYPYNNFLHHHVENIIMSCLESKNSSLLEHLLRDCDFVGKIIQAEKQFTLEADTNKPTIPAEGKSAPRIGCIGHLTRISNKLVQLGNNNSVIQEHLQGNSEWKDWYLSVLSNRNAVENVYQWSCGRPTALHDRNRDSDEDDYQDRDYDVAALANNLSQAFRYGIYNNEDIEEVHGSLERDDEDVYFDDESAEVVISSLRLGDDHESGSLFTNSNWFAFEEDRDRVANERSTGSLASPSPNADEVFVKASGDVVVAGEDEELADTATSPEAGLKLEHGGTDKPVEWVEWRESSDANDPSDVLPNGELEIEPGNSNPGLAESSSSSSSVALTKDEQIATDEPSASLNNSSIETSESNKDKTEPTLGVDNPSSGASASVNEPVTEVGGDSNKNTTDNKKAVDELVTEVGGDSNKDTTDNKKAADELVAEVGGDSNKDTTDNKKAVDELVAEVGGDSNKDTTDDKKAVDESVNEVGGDSNKDTTDNKKAVDGSVTEVGGDSNKDTTDNKMGVKHE
ncbi:Serine/threonine-protein phosphatase 6 regulatory subunit 3 isoform B [Glycine soja]|uniref:Serine/threonine-protein phosphatase 6 regulatory subunit 3 isoform A n=1 Tax=Glycine soja TaxID=3848 RepID=A0A445IVT3_GLYSO|nr:Serine/threonine-protein phosphatase 6 regulatory subunit 3 isoform A [Glycine soja]RZB90268.1 Serine/threonine-protein phosphatase 6 regulatory subunit 3 isoform B [Glycine soja]